jgi:nicotinamidase-related amidase
MKRIYHLDVAETLDELLPPATTALLLIDVQNDFCSDGGHYHRYGKDLSMIQAMLPTLQRFLAEARERGIFVVHLQQTTLPNGGSLSAPWAWLNTRDGKSPDYTLDGTWGHAFVTGFEPRRDEPVIRKHRSSGFVNTTLDTILRSHGITSVLIGGVVTQGCVESTARDAMFHDYYVAVLRDGVASTSAKIHEASLLVQSVRHELPSTDEVLAIWKPIYSLPV